MLVPLPLENLKVQAPVPFHIWGRHGVLLLRRGELLNSEQHREYLAQHSPVVDEADLKAWNYSYTAQLDRMVRGNETLTKIAGATRPVELKERAEADATDPVVVWPDLHDRLMTLLHQNVAAGDFVNRLIQVEHRAQRTLANRVDDSLFVLVQLLQDRSVSYSATHALLCATACRLVGASVGLSQAHLAALFRAALTMNIGMARLHDDLARQDRPLTEAQRATVKSHPEAGVAMLRQLGVGDHVWLQLVQDHHEHIAGDGYPSGKTDLDLATQLLRMADVYVARISPRLSRSGLLPQMAARDIYLGADGQPSTLGAAFVKTVGVYIPGSYVRLASDEIAVVMRRGRRANAPVVYAIVSREGMPFGEPRLRDTADRAYEVKGSVKSDDVKVRVQPARLLSRP